MATTIYRLAEECQLLLSGGATSGAFNPTINELKIAVAQVANSLFKVEHFQVNAGMGETIPNGAALGLYEDIAVTQYGLVSKATLPCKPLKLPRNMGIFSVFPTNYPSKEFIPLQMGQANMLNSQPLLNDLLGKIGYENFGLDLIFTKDLTLVGPVPTISVRLAIMDFSVYSDFDVIPVPADQEWEIKKQVVALYATNPIADKVVDPSTAELTGIPLNKQRQA